MTSAVRGGASPVAFSARPAVTNEGVDHWLSSASSIGCVPSGRHLIWSPSTRSVETTCRSSSGRWPSLTTSVRRHPHSNRLATDARVRRSAAATAKPYGTGLVAQRSLPDRGFTPTNNHEFITNRVPHPFNSTCSACRGAFSAVLLGKTSLGGRCDLRNLDQPAPPRRRNQHRRHAASSWPQCPHATPPFQHQLTLPTGGPDGRPGRIASDGSRARHDGKQLGRCTPPSMHEAIGLCTGSESAGPTVPHASAAPVG